MLAPHPLTHSHAVESFDCGQPILDHWLKNQALKNQGNHASQTFVVTSQTGKVIGYYALAAGSVERQAATSNLARNMPDPIPVVILGRLAVDQSMQCKSLGKSLLRDALLRTVNVAENIGVKALLVHALDDKAAQFYRGFGFQPMPNADHTLMLSVKQLLHHLGTPDTQ